MKEAVKYEDLNIFSHKLRKISLPLRMTYKEDKPEFEVISYLYLVDLIPVRRN